MNLDFFTTRKTIRKYKNKNISESEIFKMIEAAACAPTTGGMQLYSVVVSSSDEIKKQLAPCHFNQPQIENAAAVLTFCVDFNRFNNGANQETPCHHTVIFKHLYMLQSTPSF